MIEGVKDLALSIAAIAALFIYVDSIIKPEIKLQLSNWILNINTEQRKLFNPFRKMFEFVFGENHFSWKCFLRSTIASLFLFALFYRNLYFTTEVADFDIAGREMLLSMIPFILFTSIVPDYISLYQTRYILSKFEDGSSFKKTISLLLIDFILTFTIVSFFLITATFIFKSQMWDMFVFDFKETWNSIKTRDNYEQVMNGSSYGIYFPYGLFIASAFFTSIWLWLYLLTSTAFRLIALPKETLQISKKIFNIEKEPIKCLGQLIIVLIIIIYTIKSML